MDTKAILVLVLVAVILVTVNSVSTGISETARVLGPESQANADAMRLQAETQAKAERIRIEVMAAGAAQLELARLSGEQQYAIDVRNAELEAQKAKANADASVAWVGPVAGGVTIGVGVIALSIVMIYLAKALADSSQVYARNKASVAGIIRVDPQTMRLPSFVMMLPSGEPVFVNPDSGEVMLLSKPRAAEDARVRFLMAQNAHVGTRGQIEMNTSPEVYDNEMSEAPSHKTLIEGGF